jgi:hypothetical protein
MVHNGEFVFPRLIIQVWAETTRNEELSAVINDGYGSVRAAWVKVVQGYQDAGMMRDDVPAESVARTMIAAVQGFVAQMAIFGIAPVEVLQEGLRGLMSMGNPDARP